MARLQEIIKHILVVNNLYREMIQDQTDVVGTRVPYLSLKFNLAGSVTEAVQEKLSSARSSSNNLEADRARVMLEVESDICKILLAIVLPPLGVFLERGCVADFWINILLTILGYIPGIIHALYIILKY
ncbi:hypothetical protein PtB15_1B314 [Puccinia triticina]|nr:hypothetical protein PtB15_1B314 [Puccinia triticina]